MLNQSLSIVKRELLRIWHDKTLRNILLVGPLLGLLIFVGVYSFQRLDNITTAIVDLDNSSASLQLIDQLENTGDLKITGYPESFDELKELIRKGEVIVGVVIPEDYGKKVALRRQTQVAVIVDGTNMAYATNASTAILTVTRTLGAEAGIKTLIARGIEPHRALEAFQSVESREQAWFNPTLNYAYFLVLGFALNIWQQISTLVFCMNIVGEKVSTAGCRLKLREFPSLSCFSLNPWYKSVSACCLSYPFIILPLKFLNCPMLAAG